MTEENINFYKIIPEDKTNVKFPNKVISWPARIILFGPSGCGKTNAIANLLFNPKTCFFFNKLYIYAKMIDEPLYQYFINRVREMEEKVKKAVAEKQAKKAADTPTNAMGLPVIPEACDVDTKILMAADTSLDNLVTVEELNQNKAAGKQSIVIIDDLMNQDKKIIDKSGLKTLWNVARKLNTTVILVVHDFTGAGGLSANIRRSATHCIAFKSPSSRDRTQLRIDLAGEIPLDAFKRMYQYCVTPKPEEDKTKCFLLIDNNNNCPLEKKFRRGFFEYLEPINFYSEKERDA